MFVYSVWMFPLKRLVCSFKPSCEHHFRTFEAVTRLRSGQITLVPFCWLEPDVGTGGLALQTGPGYVGRPAPSAVA